MSRGGGGIIPASVILARRGICTARVTARPGTAAAAACRGLRWRSGARLRGGLNMAVSNTEHEVAKRNAT